MQACVISFASGFRSFSRRMWRSDAD